ncbi:hypothetical protein Ark11_0999 [Candidatus Ichthyocystis hellenicum]|uniref:Uncharacterized protein n=1 Tax=Candidatus Ichthyocystis hellenicum TaxID=1561003 RepID=A0A0S4M525_9BURK|nr:hypothetical protein [Candidatus Ichthyocystis hellenicum]CUT17818.1 hypothetical protein Ark11_0999 [Candidatus Ichthyocystis hellenicum]
MNHISNSELSTNDELSAYDVESSSTLDNSCASSTNLMYDQEHGFNNHPPFALNRTSYDHHLYQQGYLGFQQQCTFNTEHLINNEYPKWLSSGLENSQVDNQLSSSNLERYQYAGSAESGSNNCGYRYDMPSCFTRTNQSSSWEKEIESNSSCNSSKFFPFNNGTEIYASTVSNYPSFPLETNECEYPTQQYNFDTNAQQSTQDSRYNEELCFLGDKIMPGESIICTQQMPISNYNAYDNNKFCENNEPSTSNISYSLEQFNQGNAIRKNKKLMPTLKEKFTVSPLHLHKDLKPSELSLSVSYILAIENISVDTNDIRIFILKKIKGSKHPPDENTSLPYESCSMDLIPTLIKTRQYIKKIISPHIIGLHGDMDVPVCEGMSIHDIRILLVNNNNFFIKLSERCNQLKLDIMSFSKNGDVSRVLQSSVNVYLGKVLHKFYFPPSIKKSLVFRKNISKMIIKCVSCLPEKIRIVIENVRLEILKGWLFTKYHGVYLYNSYLRKTYATCVEVQEAIVRDNLLIDKMHVVTESIEKGSISSFYDSMKILGLVDRIFDLAKNSTDRLMNEMRESFVFNGKILVHLDEISVKNMVDHLIIDIVNMSVESYRKLCTDKTINKVVVSN